MQMFEYFTSNNGQCQSDQELKDIFYKKKQICTYSLFK